MITHDDITCWARNGRAIAGFLDDIEAQDLIRALSQRLGAAFDTILDNPATPTATPTPAEPKRTYRRRIVQGFTTNHDGTRVPHITTTEVTP
ncbi:MAG: hypothetical protein LBV06_07090 [Propionibacteriaceae bacterium]|jgi:hypothetical protein|nr:hypothetical protein [Propionibacteriaceae bacterium]